MVEACSDAVPSRGVATAGLQPAVERLEAAEHAAHVDNRVDAVGRPAAVRGPAAGLNLRPLEALVGDGDVEIGRLGDDARRRRASG